MIAILPRLLGTVALLAAAGCGSPAAPEDRPASAPTTGSSTDPAGSPSAGSGEAVVVGTVVRFSSPRASVDVTIGEDNPAVRDLLSRLPLTITLEEFAGREKIARLSGGLQHAVSPGSDSEDGDLIYFVPWGNLGFYYDASGIGFSEDTVHIGTYRADRAQLDRLQGDDVRVTAAGR